MYLLLLDRCCSVRISTCWLSTLQENLRFLVVSVMTEPSVYEIAQICGLLVGTNEITCLPLDVNSNL